MTRATVMDVVNNRGEEKELVGFSIDHPVGGETCGAHAVEIAGWVLLKSKDRPRNIQLYHENQRLLVTPVDRARPDVAAQYPRHPHSGQAGFGAWVGLLGLPQTCVIDVVLVQPSGRRIALGAVKIQRERFIQPHLDCALQPIMLTALGRSGTTWLMKALMGHPDIIVHEAYPHELRAARYWTHMLNVLSRPAAPVTQYGPDAFWHNTDFMGPNPYFMGHSINDEDLNSWFASDYIDSLAAFGMKMTQDLYQRIARRQGKLTARYFAEKHYPDRTPQLLWELYPAPREIFLVRDFRDMVSSMISFNGRRESDGFGRARFASDEAFVERLGKTHVRSMLNAWQSRCHDALLVRYEDLIADAPAVMQRILDYLGLDTSSRQVETILEQAGSGDAKSDVHRTSADARSSTGRWKQDLSRPLQDACHHAFGAALQAFGYEDAP